MQPILKHHYLAGATPLDGAAPQHLGMTLKTWTVQSPHPLPCWQVCLAAVLATSEHRVKTQMSVLLVLGVQSSNVSPDLRTTGTRALCKADNA